MIRSAAQRRAELHDAESSAATLRARLSDPHVLAEQEPETIESWREALAALERRVERLTPTND